MTNSSAEIKYGQVNWDEGNVSGGNDFMNLEQGDNEMRVLTKPYQFVVHWVKDSSGTTRKIRCAIENCPLCKKGEKTQCRWYLGVLDRKSGQPRILEISSQIYLGIKKHVNNPKWGDVTAYDISINRGPKGSQPLYTVMGDPTKSPLTDAEKVLVKNFFERVDIAKFTQPLTPEEVLEKMGVSDGNGAGGNAKPAVEAQTVSADSKPAISDEDFNFGDEL